MQLTEHLEERKQAQLKKLRELREEIDFHERLSKGAKNLESPPKRPQPEKREKGSSGPRKQASHK